MKPSKRVSHALDLLNKIKGSYLFYYMGNTEEFRELCDTDFKYIEDTLMDLAVDRKLNNIRFKKKLDIVRNIFEKNKDAIE